MFSQVAFNLSVTDWGGSTGVNMGKNPFKPGEPGYYSFLSGPGEHYGNESEHNGDYQLVLSALDFMQNDPPEPFLVFLPTKGSHPPYGAPLDYFDM